MKIGDKVTINVHWSLNDECQGVIVEDLTQLHGTFKVEFIDGSYSYHGWGELELVTDLCY